MKRKGKGGGGGVLIHTSRVGPKERFSPIPIFVATGGPLETLLRVLLFVVGFGEWRMVKK